MNDQGKADPLARFSTLLAEAKSHPQIPEPTAMTVASVGEGGRPSARILLLKGSDARGLVFYTNLQSRKGRELLSHPHVACVFWWHPLEVQVRFEGTAAQVGGPEADAYFASRPRGSQLGAWASDQSRPLASRADLEAKLAEVTARYDGKPVPRPPHWSGFLLTPSVIEFWKNQPSRLHLREVYSRESPQAPWRMQLFNP